MCEDIRQTQGLEKLYEHRKEIIERLFEKENHGSQYTQLIVIARIEMKIGLHLRA